MTGSGSRVAVVSGGGTGIGRAAAAALARDGMDVVILGRRAEVLRAAVEEVNRNGAAANAEHGGELSWDAAAANAGHGGELSWVRADVSDPAQEAEAAAVIRERYPVIDVVVNNAGGPARKAGADLGEVAGASPAYVAAKAALGGWVLSLAAQPEEVAAVIAFLASAEASYVSGQVISVDGGVRLPS